MSGNNSTSSATPEKPDRAIRTDKTIGERIEALPNTLLFFLLSFGIFLSAVVFDVAGFGVLGGVLGATAVLFMALAMVTHAVYHLLGQLD
jgi:multisubunit Na+/H+ antiporter MnhB subunit